MNGPKRSERPTRAIMGLVFPEVQMTLAISSHRAWLCNTHQAKLFVAAG
jgi:hypothetical protein